MTRDLAAGIVASSCFDGATSSLRLSVAFDTAAPAWASIGFRTTEECLMTPRGGGDGEIVYAQPDANTAYQVHYGPLSPDTKHFQAAALGNLLQRLAPIQDTAAFSSSTVEYSNGKLRLGFTRSYSNTPPIFNLTYALGSNGQVGYHSKRGCFTLTPTACPAVCRSQHGSTSGGP